MPVIVKQQCIDLGKSLRLKVEELYDPRIEATEKLIAKAIADGHDPEKTPVSNGVFSVNYRRLLEDIKVAKSEAMSLVAAEESKCDTVAVPDWVADAQKVNDFAILLAALPIVVLTKNYAATGIDLGAIYKGYPLGGEGGFVPAVREELFDTLNISGDTAKFLRDPINETAAVIASVVDALPPLPPLPPLPTLPPLPAPPVLPPLPPIDINPFD